MKLSGLLLLPAGWVIVISALVLFSQPALRWTFVLAGLCIEAGGLALIFRGTRPLKELVE